MDAVKIGVCATVQEAVEAQIAEDAKRWKSKPDELSTMRVSQAVTRIKLRTESGCRYFTVTVKEEM